MAKDESTVKVQVKLRVQYMYKDIKTDMPNMGPLSHYETEVEAVCPVDLVQYMPTYVANASDGVEPQSYCADKDVVKKWKAKLKRTYPDEFAGKLSDDEVIEGAISCSVEDSIRDVIDARWDDAIAPSLGATPTVPDGHRVGDHFIHIESWKPA